MLRRLVLIPLAASLLLGTTSMPALAHGDGTEKDGGNGGNECGVSVDVSVSVSVDISAGVNIGK